MSLLQLLVRPDRVTLVTDTLAEDAGAPAGFEVGKTLLLPAAGVAFAARGNFLGARTLWTLLSGGTDFTFDAADDHVRRALAAARPLLPPGLRMRMEFIAAGITKAGSPAAKLWTISDAGDVESHVPEVSDLLGPWSGGELPPVAPDCDANILQLARLQARQVRPGAVGGRLIVTTIERGTMVVRDLGAFC